jgi:Uncharacterized protein conserved in bacteria
MKYFIAEPIYKDPIPVDDVTLNKIINKHEDFLKLGFADGWILFCGPKVNTRGGFVILKAKSLAEIEKHFLKDPLQEGGIVTFRFTEFKLFKCQPALENWFTE